MPARSRRVLSGVLTAVVTIATALAGLAGAPISASADPNYETVVGSFETDEGWSVIPNGATGSAAYDQVTAHDGERAATINGSFPDRTGYVEFAKSGFPTVTAEGISFWVQATGIRAFTLRMIDSSGQTHQRGVDVTADAGWQLVTITDLGNVGHWGGPDDGIWRGSVMTIDVILESWGLLDGVTDASVSLDDITLLSEPPALLFSQVQLGNVFLPGEDTAFGITTAADTLEWSVTDLDGAEVASGTEAVTDAESVLTVPDALDFGWYTVHITAFADGAEIGSVANTFARLRTPPSAEDARGSTFGMGTHLPGYSHDIHQLLTRAGIGNVRDDLFWSAAEASPGSYDWTNADSYLQPVINAGIQPLPLGLYGNPLYDEGHNPTSPEGIEAYANFMVALVAQYEGDIPAVEVWNEWDLGLDGSAEKSPEAYLALIKVVYPKLKAAFPDVTVIGPADAHFNDGWLEQFFALGGLDYVDGVVLHPYNHPGDPEALDGALDGVQSLIAEYNDGVQKPLWITEIGWPGGANDPQSVTEPQQAANIVRSQLLAASRGVVRTYNYVFVNEGVDPNAFYPNFGVVHNQADPLGSFTPKPSYVAFAAMTSTLTGATFDARESVGDGAYSLRFLNGSDQIRAVWSLVPRTIEVAADGPVTITDLYGTERTLTPSGSGTVTIPIDRNVQYIEGGTAASASANAVELDPAFVDREVTGRWTHDNSEGSSAATVQLEIDGVTVEQTVAAGESATVDFTLPARTEVGDYTVTGIVREDGDAVGTLTASTTVGTAVTLTGGRAVADDGTPVLRLELVNHSPESYVVESLDWDFGGVPGTAFAGQTLDGSAVLVAEVPIGAIAVATPWSATATVGDFDQLSDSGVIAPTSGDATPVAYRTVTVDGVLDDLSGLPVIDLDVVGVPTLPAGYTGPADLGGKVWLTWDDDNLYVSARITDDIHAQFATGGSTWLGDSLQLAVNSGAPGEGPAPWSEMGFALTPDGAQGYRFSALDDPTGEIEGAVVAVERDDAAGETLYEVSVPWARLRGIDPSTRVLSASIVLNENDGSGREGYIEWGQGIASSKDSTLFKLLRLDPAPLSAIASLSDLTVGGSTVTGFASDVLDYSVELPYGTASAPAVAATATDAAASVVVTQAGSSTGTATVTVTAEDGVTQATYSVHFSVAAHAACTTTLTGTIKHTVFVAGGVTCISDANVKASVIVTGTGSVIITDSKVTGSVTVVGGRQQQLIDTTVTGSVSITGASGAVLLDAAIVKKGALFLFNHGGLTISDSTFNKVLSCLFDSPAASNGGHANTVHGARIGECRGSF